MGAKNIPEDTDGRMINSATGQRNRGALTRMSIDTTTEEKREFLIEAVEHNMTLRGYFYHCWRNSQKYEGLQAKTLGEDGVDAASQTAAGFRGHKPGATSTETLAEVSLRAARERINGDK
jgi:hypothetical protein